MNTDVTLSANPAIADFVRRVRLQLADLPDDVRAELTEGLEADLTERVAERQGARPLGEALGDPAVYAGELRLSAGLPPRAGRRQRGGALGAALDEALDSAHRSYERVLDALPGSPRAFLESLQPVWWVARAWVAWMVAQDVTGAGNSVSFSGRWFAVLALLVVASVQLGRGGWGLARLRAGAVARLVLIALNVFAVTMLPGAVDRTMWQVAEDKAWQFCADVPQR